MASTGVGTVLLRARFCRSFPRNGICGIRTQPYCCWCSLPPPLQEPFWSGAIFWEDTGLRLWAFWRRRDRHLSAATKIAAGVCRLWTGPRIGHNVENPARRPTSPKPHGLGARHTEFRMERGRGGLPNSGRTVSAPCRRRFGFRPPRSPGHPVRLFTFPCRSA